MVIKTIEYSSSPLVINTLYKTEANEFLLADVASLAVGSDLATAPKGALSYPLLTTADGSLFSINNDQTVVGALSVNANGDPTNTIASTESFELILRDINSSEVSKVTFAKDGTQTDQSVLSSAEIQKLSRETRMDIDGDGYITARATETVKQAPRFLGMHNTDGMP